MPSQVVQSGAGAASRLLSGAVVVAEHTLHHHAAVGELDDSVLQDVGRGLLDLVIVSLDVGDAGVVVDDGDGPILSALLTSHVAPAAELRTSGPQARLGGQGPSYDVHGIEISCVGTS